MIVLLLPKNTITIAQSQKQIETIGTLLTQRDVPSDYSLGEWDEIAQRWIITASHSSKQEKDISFFLDQVVEGENKVAIMYAVHGVLPSNGSMAKNIYAIMALTDPPAMDDTTRRQYSAPGADISLMNLPIAEVMAISLLTRTWYDISSLFASRLGSYLSNGPVPRDCAYPITIDVKTPVANSLDAVYPTKSKVITSEIRDVEVHPNTSISPRGASYMLSAMDLFRAWYYTVKVTRNNNDNVKGTIPVQVFGFDMNLGPVMGPGAEFITGQLWTDEVFLNQDWSIDTIIQDMLGKMGHACSPTSPHFFFPVSAQQLGTRNCIPLDGRFTLDFGKNPNTYHKITANEANAALAMGDTPLGLYDISTPVLRLKAATPYTDALVASPEPFFSTEYGRSRKFAKLAPALLVTEPILIKGFSPMIYVNDAFLSPDIPVWGYAVKPYNKLINEEGIDVTPRLVITWEINVSSVPFHPLHKRLWYMDELISYCKQLIAKYQDVMLYDPDIIRPANDILTSPLLSDIYRGAPNQNAVSRLFRVLLDLGASPEFEMDPNKLYDFEGSCWKTFPSNKRDFFDVTFLICKNIHIVLNITDKGFSIYDSKESKTTDWF